MDPPVGEGRIGVGDGGGGEIADVFKVRHVGGHRARVRGASSAIAGRARALRGESAMRDVAVKVVVSGRVQGVWFRGWVQQQARTLGLAGWVRNVSGGSVEALLAGPEARVQEMIADLHRGPRAARVRDVSWEEVEAFAGEGFEVRA